MKSNKLLVYIILVQIIAIVIILFSYGVVFDNKYQTQSEEESDKYFSMIIPIKYYRPSVDMSVIKRAFPELLGDYQDIIKDVFVESYGLLDSPMTSEEREEYEFSQGTQFYVDIFSHSKIEDNRYEYTPLLENLNNYIRANHAGELFSEEDMNQGNKVCLPHYTLYKARRDDMSICGEKYTVPGYADDNCGAWFWPNTIYIPLESTPDKAQLKKIYIPFKRMIVKSEYEDIKERICSLLGDTRYELKDYVSIDIDTKATRKTIILISIMLTALSCVSIVLIFRYRLENKKPQMAICFICGYTRLRVLVMMLKEIVVCILISGVVGYALFKYVCMSLIKKYFVWFDVIFAHHESLYIILVISLVTFIFVLFELVRYFIKNPYEMWVGKRA